MLQLTNQDVDDLALRELVDLIQQLMSYLRVGTFDEVDGEREVAERAQRFLECYPLRASRASLTTEATPD